eukprot:4772686-Prymnesium_polylepis.1
MQYTCRSCGICPSARRMRWETRVDVGAGAGAAAAMADGLVMVAATQEAVQRVGTVALQEAAAVQGEGQLAGALQVALAALMGGRPGQKGQCGHTLPQHRQWQPRHCDLSMASRQTQSQAPPH